MFHIRSAADSLYSAPLNTAERFSAATQLLSSLEYLSRRADRELGGLNNWSHTRSQVPAKTKAVQAIRDFVARERVTQGVHVSRALAAVVLISPVRNNRARLIASAYLSGSESLVYLRHLFGTDGSDQVAFLVQAAATLGRAGGTAGTRDAAVQFIGAQTVLSYGASGWAKLAGDMWRSGDALVKIMRTQTYGDERIFNLLKKYPTASRTLCHVVVALESGFPLLLLKKGKYIDAGLTAMGLFHLANARFMGLSRFAWAFLSTYPSVRALAKGTNEGQPNSRKFVGITAVGLASCLVAGLAHQSYATIRTRAGHAGFERHQVRCSSGNIVTYYLRRGTSGGPTLVCEAGLMSSSAAWLLVADHLDPSISVVVYDRAGYRSSLRGSLEDYSIGESVSDLADVITDAVGAEGRCVLAGHSLGGYLAHRVAAIIPDLVRGLVLVDPMHPRQLTHSRRRREGARGTNLAMRLGRWSAVFGSGMLLDKKGMFSAVAGSPYYRTLRLESSSPGTWNAARREWSCSYSFMLDGGRSLDRLQIPISVMVAESTIRDFPEYGDLHEDYIKSGTGGRVVTVTGSSHQSIIDGMEYAPRTAQLIEETVMQIADQLQERTMTAGGVA